ncbi:MAG TPA: winged helix DNA-binding domain-containing protein, partial [Gemmatimonadaceae bacterium]
IDASVLRRSRAVLTKALRDSTYLTRRELADALTRAGVRADGTQRLAHLMIHAELDGLVCSGPRRGKQFTYALMDERVPPTKKLERDTALHTLAKKYFTTRGPATVDDFAWWSGLTKTDAKAAISSLGSNFDSEVIAGRSYWFPHTARVPVSRTPIARLLPTYDEYLVGYADRRAAHTKVSPSEVGEAFDFLGSNVMTIDGQIVGRWKREIIKDSVDVSLQPLTSLTDGDRAAIVREIAKFKRFVGST